MSWENYHKKCIFLQRDTFYKLKKKTNSNRFCLKGLAKVEKP